ncbi:MAG: alpha/beta hydrolase [Patescibacteria group bacterium]
MYDLVDRNKIIEVKYNDDIKYNQLIYVPNLNKDKKVRILVWLHGSILYDNQYSNIPHQMLSTIKSICKYCTNTNTIVLTPVLPRNVGKLRLDSQIMSQEVMIEDLIKDGTNFFTRPDLELIKMIDLMKLKLNLEGLKYHKKIFIGGVSAGGLFANRFSLLHPASVDKVALLLAGDYIYPISSYKGLTIGYPFGINDIDKISDNEFSIDKFKKIPYYLYVGDKDMNDPIEFELNYDRKLVDRYKLILGKDPVDRLKEYYKYLKSLQMNVNLDIGKNLGHEVADESKNKVFNFFMQ